MEALVALAVDQDRLAASPINIADGLIDSVAVGKGSTTTVVGTVVVGPGAPANVRW